MVSNQVRNPFAYVHARNSGEGLALANAFMAAHTRDGMDPIYAICRYVRRSSGCTLNPAPWLSGWVFAEWLSDLDEPEPEQLTELQDLAEEFLSDQEG